MKRRTLILGLGNELLADDAVGVLAIRELQPLLADRDAIELVETPEHGLALLDSLVGYDEAIILDAIQTGRHPPGSVMEINPAGLREIPAPSPHFAGLPEILALGRRLGLKVPHRISILAVEVIDPLTLGGPLSPEVRHAIPRLCERVMALLSQPNTAGRS